MTVPFQQRTLFPIVEQREYSAPYRGTDNMAGSWLHCSFPAIERRRSPDVVK